MRDGFYRFTGGASADRWAMRPVAVTAHIATGFEFL